MIQLDLTDSEIRLDGLPRATAKPASPMVIVSFESRHGPLRYMTDVFLDWKANLRAIALGLEALRKVDRYGITKRGEQYRGWAALPAGADEEISTPEQAARFISEYSWQTIEADTPAEEIIFAYRRAAKRLHPDVAGVKS